MRTGKKWIISFVCFVIVILLFLGGLVAWVDPYFHFHKPHDYFMYSLENERYQNDGILKHFEYDAVITGSSMTECFKTSEMDALFGTNSVKVPFSGGSYKEVNDNLKTAVANNKDLRMVVRCLDANRFFDDKDKVDYTDYPTYLYDKNIFNDVKYLLNMEVLFETRAAIKDAYLQNGLGLNFDVYANWSDYESYGKEAVDEHYEREIVEKVEKMLPVTEEEYAEIAANIEQNVISLARDNPDIEFYLYFSPYSIYYMDYMYLTGRLERQLLAEKYIIEQILPYDNIHLFSFFTQYDTITNLDNYKDIAHSSGTLNSQILRWMYDGVGELSYDNYEAYCAEEWDYYMNYDYEALFAE